MAYCYVKAYFDWIEQTAALSDAERGRLFIAILEYGRSGLEPKLDGRESILFPVFRSAIDRDNKQSKTNAENGAKGGRGHKAIKSETKQNKVTEIETKPTKEKEKDKDEEKDDILSPLPPLARETLREWVAYKAERREPYKPRGLQSLVTQVGNSVATHGEAAVVDVIRRSMAANYKGIVFDWLEKPKRATQIVTKHGEMGDFEREAARRMMERSGTDDA